MPLFFFALWAAFLVAVAVGWIANVIELIGLTGSDPAPMIELLLRIVGLVVVPFGAIMGYFV